MFKPLGEKKLIHTLAFVCLTALGAAGQTLRLADEPLLERLVGNSGQGEALRSVAINWRGDVACTGTTSNGDNGGEDVLLVLFDAQLNIRMERQIGRQGDDGAAQVAVLPDGRYVVVGYTTKPESWKNKGKPIYWGKKDGWVLVLDERGNTEKELVFGTPDDDVFSSVAVSPDGHIWLSGVSGQAGWAARLDRDLNVVWEKKEKFANLPTAFNAATLGEGGLFFVAGKAGNQMVLGCLSQLGERHFLKNYPLSPAEEGIGIVTTVHGMLAVAGNVRHPQERENSFLCLVSPKGEMLRYKPVGGREFDRANGLHRLHNGQLLLLGASASEERGSRRAKGWAAVYDEDEDKWEQKYYGSKLNDEAFAAAEHPDGRLFIVGVTSRKVLKMKQGWIFQLLPRSDRKPRTEHLSAKMEGVSYHDGAAFLQSNGRAVITVSLENKGNKGASNLRAELRLSEQSAEHLIVPGGRSVLFPPVSAGERVTWGMPVQVSSKLAAGTYPVSVQIYQSDQPIGNALSASLQVGAQGPPQLEVGFDSPPAHLTVGEVCELRVEVRNLGGQTANGAQLIVATSPELAAPVQVAVGDLKAGELTQKTIPLLVAQDRFEGQSVVQVKLRVADNTFAHTATSQIDLKLTPKTPQAAETSKVSGSPVAVWLYPNPDNFDRPDIVWHQDEITVQVKIVSKTPIQKQHFCIEINGQPCAQGEKFDEVQVKGSGFSQTFSQTVKLREGNNTLRANCGAEGAQVSTQPLNIQFAPAKPNLHVLAIGVPSSDLKFPPKDARDFAQAMLQLPNEHFAHVFVDTLLTEAMTTKTAILKALRKLQYRHADLQISPKDLLIVFVSGHGLSAYDGTFRLAASDYDGPFMHETSLDFENEILNYLQTLPCHKVFLVDACQSGTASGRSLADLADKRKTLNLMLSCQANEYSYEDETWQNGAFTRALVGGLKKFAQNPGDLDLNLDHALDLHEWFEYAKKEVPQAVEKKRPKTKTAQHPKLNLANPAQAPIILRKKH